MVFKITNPLIQNAKKLGVEIKPSKNKGKKIDVYKKGVKLTSIGGLGYEDYNSYIDKKGIEYANQRKELYKKRHERDRNKIGSAGYYADKILWN